MVPTVLRPHVWMNRAWDVFNTKPCILSIHKARRAHVQEVRRAKRKLKTTGWPGAIPNKKLGHKMHPLSPKERPTQGMMAPHLLDGSQVLVKGTWTGNNYQKWRCPRRPPCIPPRPFMVAQLVKNLPEMQEMPVCDSWVGEIRWRRDRLSTPVFLGFPGGSAGKESACNAGVQVWSLGWEDSPGEGKG